jgi:predicted Holliday junction resolvase-like endonuclease
MMILEITLSNGWSIVIGVIILIIIISLIRSNHKIEKLELEQKKKEAELKVTYQDWALSELEKFKQNEILKVQKTAEELSMNAARIVLQRWKIENEAWIRQDAINRSYSVNLGKITEHLVPFHVDFPFNPKDARFIGSPIDMIVFDGHSEKREEIIIYIVEVKTGNSKLTPIQQKIKAAVLKGDIRWAEINPDNKENEFGMNDLNNIPEDQLPLDLK